MTTLYINADTGWRTEPRWAGIDIIGSSGTTMQHLSDPSPRRTISGYYEGDGSTLFAGETTVTINGITGYLVNVSGRRLQNVGGAEWWNITVELQQIYD